MVVMEDPVWRLFQSQDGAMRAAGDEMQAALDALFRAFLRPDVLQRLADSAGMDPCEADRPDLDPYRVLGLERTTPDAEVKKRYRELLHKLHPDTAGVKGTAFLLQLVLAAYRQIEKERGWQR